MPTGMGRFWPDRATPRAQKFTVKTAYQLITMPSYNATTGSLTLNFATPPFALRLERRPMDQTSGSRDSRALAER